MSGVALLALLLVLQLLHHNRQSLALNPTFGPAAAKVYGWFGVVLMPRWDLTAYSVKQLGAEAEGSEGTQLARAPVGAERQLARAAAAAAAAHAAGSLRQRRRDARSGAARLPAASAPRISACSSPISASTPNCTSIDPGKAAIGFEIDACLRGEGGDIGCANDARRRAAG